MIWRACSSEPSCSGISGRYFIVRKFDSEYGLSFDVCGRLWLFAMPRST
jgi:hypothetical protein